MNMTTTGFTPNREAVEAGLTWSAEHGRWMTHEENGAEVSRAPDGWWMLFGLDYHEGRELLRRFRGF